MREENVVRAATFLASPRQPAHDPGLEKRYNHSTYKTRFSRDLPRTAPLPWNKRNTTRRGKRWKISELNSISGKTGKTTWSK